MSMKPIMLINRKMPTIVGISTIISMVIYNSTSENLNARKLFDYQNVRFYSAVLSLKKALL